MKKKTLYIDLDGVVANFDKMLNSLIPDLNSKGRFPNEEAKSNYIDTMLMQSKNVFMYLEPMPGAITAIKELFAVYDVYFLSAPIWKIPESYTDKRLWVEMYFGHAATKRLILTHHKEKQIGDYLVDNRLKHGAGEFTGKHIHFGTSDFPGWGTVLEYLLGKAAIDSIPVPAKNSVIDFADPWLSPVEAERGMQEKLLKSLFTSYPGGHPKFQYFNTLLMLAISGNGKMKDAEHIYNKAIQYAQSAYVEDSKNHPALLLGDVAQIIKITTGKDLDWEILKQPTDEVK